MPLNLHIFVDVFTVYKSVVETSMETQTFDTELCNLATQTTCGGGTIAANQEQHTQTSEVAKLCHLETQTTHEQHDIATQTRQHVYQTTPTQTYESRVHQSFADVVVSTTANLSTQIDAYVDTDANLSTQTDAYVDTDANLSTQINTYINTDANLSSQADVGVITDANLSTQTDACNEAYVKTRSSSIQVAVEVAQVECQARVEMRNIRLQTIRVGEIHSEVQTDDPMLADMTAQTDMSISRQCEQQTQVELIVVDVPTQTETVCQSATSQTAVSMAQEADSSCQASVDTTDIDSQTTEALLSEVFAQTDVSMALQSEKDSQAVVDCMSELCQTEIHSEEVDCQTEMSMSRQMDGGTQCTASQVFNTSSQTETAVVTEQETQVQVDNLNQTSQTNVELTLNQLSQTDIETTSNQPSQANSLATVAAPLGSQDPNESFDDFANSTHDNTFTDEREDVELPRQVKVARDAETKDGMAQTDPVTIIIGDASFLVKKLKSSAVSPSKVTTSGNEIEIELCADTPAEDVEEKENELHRRQQVELHPQYRQQQEQPLSRGGPMVRGGVAGGRGRGGGARFRMPATYAISSQSRQEVPQAVARNPTGPMMRLPAPVRQQVPIIVSPNQQQQQRPVSGPQPVVGGNFSCPFCSLTFIDSPALYEHLSINHQVDQRTKWKQPKGREGKTIIPRKTKSPERDPPILTPIEPFSVRQGVQKHEKAQTPRRQMTEEDKEGNVEDPGLFEDLSEQTVVKKKRGRPSKAKDQTVEDIDHSFMSEESEAIGEPSASKRRRVDRAADDDDYVPKGRGRKSAAAAVAVADEELEDSIEDDGQEELMCNKKGGRTPRGRRK